MAGQVTRVLVIDDSEVVRRLVTAVVNNDPDFDVVGTAGNGSQALELMGSTQPDVVVLDLDMPVMNGLETFPILRTRHPDVRVVVLSNIEPPSASAVARAVRNSEAAFVPKPVGMAGVKEALARLQDVLLPALHTDLEHRSGSASDADRVRLKPTTAKPIHAVMIGASTGGPQALEMIFSKLMRPLPVPVFVVQHIISEFSDRLAARLDHESAATVVMAGEGMEPEPGTVYLAPGGVHLVLANREGRVVTALDSGPPVNSSRPSVDRLFTSAAKVYGPNQLGVVLTGMGQDGLAGCRTLAGRGAPVLVQDQASSVVWGMPGSVARAGLADEIAPIPEIMTRICRWVAGGHGQSESS